MKAVRILNPHGNKAPSVMRDALVQLRVPLPTKEELEKAGLKSADNGDEYAVTRTALVLALKSAQRYGAAEYWQKEGDAPYLRFRKKLCELLD